MLGIGTHDIWFDNVQFNYYKGKNGFERYKGLLNKHSYDDIQYLNGIPIEDDFTNATVGRHFEKGIDSDFSSEIRYDRIAHPIFPEEIMTGFLTNRSYLSELTVGVLQDMGYGVNYASKHIKNPILLYPNNDTNLLSLEAVPFTKPQSYKSIDGIDETICFANYQFKSSMNVTSFPKTDPMMYITVNEVNLDFIDGSRIELNFEYQKHSRGEFFIEFELYINNK